MRLFKSLPMLFTCEAGWSADHNKHLDTAVCQGCHTLLILHLRYLVLGHYYEYNQEYTKGKSRPIWPINKSSMNSDIIFKMSMNAGIGSISQRTFTGYQFKEWMDG